MKLTRGQSSQNFEVKDIDGNIISLKNLRGKKNCHRKVNETETEVGV